MANGLYYAFRNGQLGAGSYTPIDFSSDAALKFCLTDNAGADGAPDITTDDFYDDIDGSTIDTLSTALTPASVTIGTVAVGVVDHPDLTPAWTTVSGATVESVSMLKDSGTPATSPLIGYWDSFSALTPNGGDVNLGFSASGIFKF